MFAYVLYSSHANFAAHNKKPQFTKARWDDVCMTYVYRGDEILGREGEYMVGWSGTPLVMRFSCDN